MRTILHLDADAFFASVEQATDARLRGKPVAVGGEKRGIIASASYEARKFGIYTPMPSILARRLCPRLVLLPGDFDKYELFSHLMFSYAYDFTPDAEIGSIDEGYFDLTGTRKPALDIAETIRRAIRQSLKLSVSEGVGSNKLVSQIASKLKKPDSFQWVPPGQEALFLSPLANRWLPGIGPHMANQLNAAGLARIGQIAHTPADLLGLIVGSLAPQLTRFARGIDERPVVPTCDPAKSFGHQETFAADTTDEEFLQATLRRMADKLMAAIREEGKSIRTVTVKVRYNDMDEEQASESLAEPTDLETEVYSTAARLLRKAWKRRVSLRLVSLKFSNVYDGRFHSGLALEVSARYHDAQQRLADIVDELRQKYGRGVVLRGHDFILRNKQERGQEPSFEAERAVPGAPQPSQPMRLAETASPPYSLAVVKRQRLGHHAARQPPDGKGRKIIHTSPAPELRFRVISKAGPAVPGAPLTTDSLEETRRLAGAANPASATPISPRSPPKRRATYVPLNVHSCYSFLDSTLSINALVDLAARYELPAIALTDKNNLHGAVEFAQAAAKAGTKPIIGAELEWNGQRLCLYVENQKGYHNLCRILTRSSRGNEAVPRSRRREEAVPRSRRRGEAEADCFEDHWSPPRYLGGYKDPPPHVGGYGVGGYGISDCESTDGLLAVSPAAELAQFFPSRFYLEVSDLEFFKKCSNPLPAIASFPIHYEQPSDRWKYDIVQSIRTLTLLRQEHPQKRLDGEYHFRTPARMQQLFAAHPELLAHSFELADRCSFEFALGQPQFPGFTPPDGSTPSAFLRRLVMEGLQRRYPKDHLKLKPQLEQELAIITDVGYEEYFLVMWDILQDCRKQGIEWITRGSAADSLACYCLGISNVCPIRFDLYFRRFLNKDRMALNKLPDIDVDFPHDRKDDVIDLIFAKYGAEHTAVVGGFSTFQSRSAFAEVAKVLGVSEYQVRRLTERLPHFSRAGELAEAVATTQECRELPFEEEPYRSALHMAHFLDGFPRYPKMHPCGLVLSRQPINQISPCFISAKGYPTTHFDMDSVEAVGLVKMDILAQGGLAVMRDVQQMLKSEIRSQRSDVGGQTSEEQRQETAALQNLRRAEALPETRQRLGVRLSSTALIAEVPRRQFSKISNVSSDNPAFHLDLLEPWDDPEVWRLIANGHARAVHHIESPAMISLCKMCNAQDIDTLIAIVSVIRPGAANESKKMEFARRYQGLSPAYYPHPSLEPCLRSTYGLVVYEEHILQICEAFAGLPPGRADILRRALAKDKPDIIAEIQSEFAACARARGHTESKIAEVWELVTGFQGYAFCKAHSTAYGVEAYQSAWLKRYYPAQFMAGVLTNGKGFYDPLVYVLECHRLGIPLLRPWVNQPGPQFTVTNGKIRVPVLHVKGLTQRTTDTLLREHTRAPFASLHDFFLRVQPLNEEMESLIQAGAFDDFGESRTRQYWEFRALTRGQRTEGRGRKAEARDSLSTSQGEKAGVRGQVQLWLLPPENLDRLPSVPLVEPTHLQRLRWEEELLGYPVSGHPLELYPDIAWDTYCPINRLGEHIGEQIVTCGLVIEQRLFHQVTGEPMKFITIADWTGVAETELFAKTYKSYGLSTVRYRVLEITATVEPFENGRGHTLRVLRAGKPRTKKR